MDTTFETIVSCVQLCLTAALIVWAAVNLKRSWVFQLILGSFGCYFLGMLFVTLHYFILHDWPWDFSASDLSFLGFYCFFAAAALGLQKQWSDSDREKIRHCWKQALVGPALVIVFHVWYTLVAGLWLNNLLYCIAISTLVYSMLVDLLAAHKGVGSSWRHYYRVVLVIISLELVSFLLSSYAWYESYYVLDCAQTVLMLLIIPAAQKGAATQ